MSRAPFSQSDLSFAVGPKFQTVWGLREAAVFTLEGVGVSAFLGFALTGQIVGMACALAAVIVAVFLLLSHLGKPMVAWRAIVNVRRSWISRGTVAIGLFCVLGALYIAGSTTPVLVPVEGIQTPLLYMVALVGLFILLYPGLAMAASAGVAFWTTPLLPILSLLQGVASGFFVVLATVDSEAMASLTSQLPQIGFGLIAALAIFMIVYAVVMLRRGGAAALSSTYLVRKNPLAFWALSVGLGLALPCIVLLADIQWGLIVTIAAIGRLVGDVAFRYTILKVGSFESVI
ncbi:MAG: polysulfide reductase NrfD [Rhodospirillaceae bacterium]|jgi:sulfite dehydrogenase (quinone) subunit SoeC|nr:polysulfide reductase NrfD [Rhodospirillaceae bacterium]MBT5566404.1 polysulfide reductase NrfD [Rhodospirillaceae bacterium]MBT7450602.1 polysulfide reductase NrfD [Rhodospirillaceae bacterium]